MANKRQSINVCRSVLKVVLCVRTKVTATGNIASESSDLLLVNGGVKGELARKY
jgi:hypothetical protein